MSTENNTNGAGQQAGQQDGAGQQAGQQDGAGQQAGQQDGAGQQAGQQDGAGQQAGQQAAQPAVTPDNVYDQGYSAALSQFNTTLGVDITTDEGKQVLAAFQKFKAEQSQKPEDKQPAKPKEAQSGQKTKEQIALDARMEALEKQINEFKSEKEQFSAEKTEWQQLQKQQTIDTQLRGLLSENKAQNIDEAVILLKASGEYSFDVNDSGQLVVGKPDGKPIFKDDMTQSSANDEIAKWLGNHKHYLAATIPDGTGTPAAAVTQAQATVDAGIPEEMQNVLAFERGGSLMQQFSTTSYDKFKQAVNK